MEKINFEPAEGGSHKIEDPNRNTFERYLHDLNLTEDEIRGKAILDIGAGRAEFARYTKDHNINDKVYGISLSDGFQGPFKERAKQVRATAESLPFLDGSFDLVISEGALPGSYVGVLVTKGKEEAKKAIYNSLSEQVRVLRRGKEIRLGRVPGEHGFKNSRLLRECFLEVLEEISEKLDLNTEVVPEIDTYEDVGENGEAEFCTVDLYIIHKPL